MIEVNIQYSVPENLEELESLVGRSVGVKTGDNFPIPMSLFGSINGDYEFLQQASEGERGEEKDLDIIWGWKNLKGHVQFQGDAVKLCQDCKRIERYSPESPGYQERLKVIKENKQWREPAK